MWMDRKGFTEMFKKQQEEIAAVVADVDVKGKK